MTEFSPISALIGGTFIGVASVLLMFGLRRIAGISTILGGTLRPAEVHDLPWRLAFIVGLLVAPSVVYSVWQAPGTLVAPASLVVSIVAGLLVGFGAALGSGCTSGHGVCGTARLSPRSIVATAVFMLTAIVTVYVTRHVWV